MLTLLKGVVPVVSAERNEERLAHMLVERRILLRGEVVVFINVSDELARIDSNFINVQRIG